MKGTLIRAILLLATLTIVSCQSVIGYNEYLTSSGIPLTPSLSTGDTDPLLYYYKYNATATVVTKSTTTLGFVHWLWIRLIPELSTSEEKQFLVTILNTTDYQGNEELCFNNTKLQHQPVFQVGKNVRTGTATIIRISNQLALDHLELAKAVLSHITPTFSNVDANRLFLSTEMVPEVDDGSGKTPSDQKVTVINVAVSPEGDDKGEGTRKISVGSDGDVKASTESYSLRLDGLSTVDGQGNPVGEPTPSIRLQINDTFALVRTEAANSAIFDLARSFLKDDKSVLAYTPESFDAVVKAARKVSAEESKDSNTSTEANLRAEVINPTDISLTRGAEVNYELSSRKEVLVNAPIISRILKLTLMTTINYVIADSAPDATTNKIGVIITLLFEFADKSLPITIANTVDFLAPDYYNRQANPSGFWDIVLPIRFGDGRINFDMTVRLNYAITSSHNLAKIGNQLTLSRDINIIVDCNAAIRTPNRGGIIGYAHFRGRVINIATSQATIAVLANPLQVSTNFVATLNPFSYQLYQSFQTYGCWRRTFLWWGKRIWCNWQTAVDQWWSTTSVVNWNTSFKNGIAIQ